MATSLAPIDATSANEALFSQKLDQLNAQLASAQAAGDAAVVSSLQGVIDSLNAQRQTIYAQASALDTPDFQNYLLDLLPTQGDTSASGPPASFSLTHLLSGLETLSVTAVAVALGILGTIVYFTIKATK